MMAGPPQRSPPAPPSSTGSGCQGLGRLREEPTCTAPCHQWTAALSQRKRMKCSTTEASWPVQRLQTLLGAVPRHQSSAGCLLTVWYKQGVEGGREAAVILVDHSAPPWTCPPQWDSPALCTSPPHPRASAHSLLLDSKQMLGQGAPGELTVGGGAAGHHGTIGRILWRGSEELTLTWA